VKGKSVAHPIKVPDAILINKLEEKQQSLQVDIFYLEEIPFFLSLSNPLNMCVVDQLKKGDKSFQNLSKLLGDHINLYKSEGFYINTIYSDNEPAMTALRSVIHAFGARHLTGGVKSVTIARVDRYIRLSKERVRSILHSLPFSIPKFLLPWVVSFAVSRLNLMYHLFSKEGRPSPRELFTGRKVDYQRDIRVSFGDYCECFSASTDNSMKERTLSCIALCPTNNKNGSILFYSLKSKIIIRCDN
jgi:hypothetical protein